MDLESFTTVFLNLFLSYPFSGIQFFNAPFPYMRIL